VAKLLNMLLNRKIDEAGAGREFWIKILKEYCIKESDYVLLLPTNDYEYNHFSLFYLEEYLRKKNSSRAIILCTSSEWSDKAKSYSPFITDSVRIKPIEAEYLMSFYCLYEFSDHIIFGSLNEPEGRFGENIIGIKGLTIEDVIKVTLYDISL